MNANLPAWLIRAVAATTATAPVTSYSPSHPWYYLEGGQPVPADDIPAGGGDAQCLLKMHRVTPAKLAAMYREQLATDLARYEDLRARGAVAVSTYDHTIAYGGDTAMAVAGSLALAYNHIVFDRGILRDLDQSAPLIFAHQTFATT